MQTALSQNLSWLGDLPNTFGLTSKQQNEEHFGGGQNSTDHEALVNTMSMIPSTQTTPRSRTPIFSPCECLQQLTSLLAHFKELSRAQDTLEPDLVLVTARDALSCWRRHLHCGTCQQNGDEDILVVFVMGFREMLSLIHRVSRPERHQIGDKTATISPRQFQPTLNLEIDAKVGPVQTLNADDSFLGMYKLSKEEKTQAVDVLLYRTVKNIDRTVRHIKQRSIKALGNFADVDSTTLFIPFPTSTNEIPSRPSSEDGMDSSDDCSTPGEAREYLQQSFNSLSKSIESLQHTLQCFQSAI